MKVLVIGSGGREHALCWKFSRSGRVKKLFCAPGNAGTEAVALNVAIKAEDIKALLEFAIKEKIDLTCVGPEGPLVTGIVNAFEREGLKIFGPSKSAAALEKSKVYAKDVMSRCGIPTAKYRVYSDPDEAKAYARECGTPLVVKAEGLALGKGVTVCATVDEAMAAIDEALVKKAFKEAGDRIVIEDCLIGEEASILAVSDGKNRVILESSQDHKRVFDGDKGPNTGGMGAYSPAPVITKSLLDEIDKKVIVPTIQGMAREGAPYKGVLYAGIMVTADGPKVLEYNVRFGDPETQAILPRLESDLAELMLASIDGTIDKVKVKWNPRPAVSVVLASGGYPGSYEKGKDITGLEEAGRMKDVFIFHAGTRRENGKILTSGGRVLNVVGMGSTVREAIDTAYKACALIRFEGMHYRRDIGYRALK